MKKRFLSITLALSIVASLFAGLSFSASATAYTDYTAVGNNGKGNISDTGKDATRNLIGDKLPSGAYLYNTIENTNGIAMASTPTTFEMDIDSISGRYIGNLTSKSNVSSQTSFFKSDVYCKYMWGTYGSDNKVNELINDETKRWAQVNYTLDGEAAIDTFIFGDLVAGHTTHFWQMPGHYKVIFSDTEAGLLDLEQAKAVIEVDETQNEEFRKNRHIVTLKTPVTAKYVGLRMICGLNQDSVGTAALSNMYMERFTFFGVFGNYTTPAEVPDSVATATATDLNGTAISGIATTATVSYAGNLDDSGKTPSAGVVLSAPASATISDKYYAFKGWHLGGDLITEKASDSYAFTGEEGALDFVAKYEHTYKPFTDFAASGDNSKAVEDAATSLIAGKSPTAGYYYNAVENHHGLATTAAPTKFDLNATIADLTQESPVAGDRGLFADLNLSRYMFKAYGADNKVNAIINDETKQWAQINYELDGKATISKVRFGNFRGSYFWQAPSHYKIILSDTADGLLDLTKANAVIDVDMDKNSALRAGMQVVTLNAPATAKYVAIRFICTANSAIIGQPIGNMYTDRMVYFGVFGEYTNAATLPEATTSATAKDANGNAIDGVSATASLGYIGNDDTSGDYAMSGVKLNAPATAEVGDKYYVFTGWYLGETLVTDKAVADYVATGAEENFDFVAKFLKTYKPYTDYTAAGQSAIGTLDGTGKDANKNLVLDKAPYEGYVYNTIENDKNIAVTEEPTKFDLNKDIVKLTDADLASCGTTFSKTEYTKFMWANYGGDGKASEIINDESKRWSQINYELDGQATINTFVYGVINQNAGGQYWQLPGHYKVIFSDTKEGLFDLEKANAVIEVDETKNDEFKKNRHTITLNTPVTAKYVGFRMICGLNNASVGVTAGSNMYMDRVTHLGVYGTYTADLTGEVSVATEEGLPSTLVSKSDVVYSGNVDDNGKYAIANVTVTAEEYTVDYDTEKVYLFAGWYNGDEHVSAEEDYVYNLANGSVTLTAKYSEEKICAIEGHKYTNYVYNEDATCLEDGTKTALCDYGCGKGVKTITAEGTQLEHKYTNYVYNNDATCQKDGTKTAVCDYECGVGTHTVTATGTKKAHAYGANYVSAKATLTADGAISKKCACGTVVKVSTIYRAKTISVASSVSYTGKSLKPKVTVKDAAGKTISSSNYTLTYSKNKAVGKASVKVTFKGNYSGTKTLSFKIVPKKTSISSLKAGKKSLTVKYKKQTSGTGYEIQYSTSSKFKSAKTVKISKNKTVSKTIKKLKSKKTYYVRVRVTKGSSYKSSWSSVKKIKVK